MASSDLTIHVRLRDQERTRLFVYEMTRLVDKMRVMASPHAEQLDHALERYIGGGDDEGEGMVSEEFEATVDRVDYVPCPNCGYVEPER